MREESACLGTGYCRTDFYTTNPWPSFRLPLGAVISLRQSTCTADRTAKPIPSTGTRLTRETRAATRLPRLHINSYLISTQVGS